MDPCRLRIRLSRESIGDSVFSETRLILELTKGNPEIKEKCLYEFSSLDSADQCVSFVGRLLTELEITTEEQWGDKGGAFSHHYHEFIVGSPQINIKEVIDHIGQVTINYKNDHEMEKVEITWEADIKGNAPRASFQNKQDLFMACGVIFRILSNISMGAWWPDNT